LIRLLLDQGAPYRAAARLTGIGIDTIHVGDLGLSEASDETILRTARELSRIVVTFDADFHALMALSGASEPSVIFLRIQRLNYIGFAALIERVCAQLLETLKADVLVTVTSNGVRTRALPIVNSSR
jgi:predicted nuclease of predicted toxin-antitoxin system